MWMRVLCRAAALALPFALAGCDIDWSAPAAPLPVSNASNGQPQSPSSLPRGAGSYGNPPNEMRFPKFGTN